MDRFHHTVKAGSLKRFALQAEAITVSLSDRASIDDKQTDPKLKIFPAFQPFAENPSMSETGQPGSRRV